MSNINNQKILICFGTRPEYIKVKSLIENLPNIKTCFTGQHPDLLKDINVDYKLSINKEFTENRLNNIFLNILSYNIFHDSDYVLVQGDTSSACAIALSAFNNGKKIIHLEAGLRSGNLKDPYPEEMNRQVISRLSDIHLCPTEFNKQNLIKENVSGEIYVVGNTGLDNISREGCKYSNQVLITMHRRDNHYNMDKWFEKLEKIANKYSDMEFMIPLHPNPNVKKHKDIFKKVKVVQPMNHNDLIEYVKKCKFVISDSGGLQEECSYLNKKIIVCRKTTERPESVGIHSFMCGEPEILDTLVDKINENYHVDAACPYGDGNSWKKIINSISKKKKQTIAVIGMIYNVDELSIDFINKYTGLNTGNLLFRQGILELIDVNEYNIEDIYFVKNWEDIDYLIVNCANLIGNQASNIQYTKNLIDRINKISNLNKNCKFIISSLGQQMNGEDIELNSHSIEFIRLITKKCDSIIVRDELTKHYIDKYNSKCNVIVGSCPSLLLCNNTSDIQKNYDNLQIKIEKKEKIKILFGMQYYEDDKYKNFFENIKYIFPNNELDMHILCQTYYYQHKKLKDIKNVFYFNNLKTCFDNFKPDIYIGYRLHGCILSLAYNIPSILVYHDKRTELLGKLLKIPTYDNCSKINISNLDFNNFCLKQTEIKNIYINYFNEIGIKTINDNKHKFYFCDKSIRTNKKFEKINKFLKSFDTNEGLDIDLLSYYYALWFK